MDERERDYRATRRSVVRGAAWTVPAVAVATAAPAFAMSPCANKTAPLPVTWSSSASTMSQTGTTSNGTTVNVTAAYTPRGLVPGSINGGNLAAQAAGSPRDSFSIVSNTPISLSTDTVSANFQTVTFTFTAPVFGLTFSIDDIDRGSGYWDHVSLSATPVESPTPTYAGITTITGAGTDGDPWRTTATSGGDNLASQSVTASYANGVIGVTQVQLRFWSTMTTLSSVVHVIRIRQMSFRTCQ